MGPRASVVVSAGVICAWLAGSVSAAGSIDTTGTTLAPGSAPTQGTVTIDAAAAEGTAPAVPRLQPLGGIGTFTIDLPNQDLADGGDTPFAATTSQTLSGGEYEFSTFDIDAGVVVTLTGSVTVHTTGAVNVLGKIVGEGNTSIRFDCGSDFTLGAGAAITSGSGQIAIDAEGDFGAGAAAVIWLQDGDVTVRTHQAAVSDGDIHLAGAQISGVATNVTLQAEGSLTATDGAGIGATSGNMIVQAFGGDVAFSGGSGIWVTSAPDAIRIEAERSISLSGSSATSATGVFQTAGVIRLRAFGGGLQLADGAQIRLTSGVIDLGALQDVQLTDTASLTLTVGRIRLTSFESDVLIQPTAMTGAIVGNGVDVGLVAARNVVIDGPGTVGTTSGTLRVEAHDGDVTFAGGIDTFHTVGRAEVLASGSIAASGAGWHHTGILLSAEDGGIDVNLGSSWNSATRSDGFVAVSKGDLRVRGELTSSGDVALASCDGSVDAAGVSITTFASDPESSVSPRISIESFAGDTGTIDATGASLVTGNASATSGDIALVIHDGKSVVAEEGFMVPESVVTKRNVRNPRNSVLTVAGLFDGGPEVRLDGDATLTVGDREVPVVLRADRRGRVRARGRGHDLQVIPARSGSSRASFRLKVKSNPNGYLSKLGDGGMTLRLKGGSFDSAGFVTVSAGTYRTGRKPGSVIAPTIFPTRCELRPTDAGQDAFVLVAGFAPDGAAPASAPDIRVTCGDGFVASIPGAAFGTAKDSVFTAVAPVAGVSRVVLDYVRGTLTIETSGIELGSVSTTESLDTVLGVKLANDQRAIRVRLGRARGRLQY